MIVVVDSGVANLESVMAALRRISADAEISSDADKIRNASHVIIPGVGAAAAAMVQLKSRNLIEPLRSLRQPTLGICLGMQVMFEHSTEGAGVDGLGIIPGKIDLLMAKPNCPVPHMGWNTLQILNKTHPLLHNIADKSYVYFVHSFAAVVSDLTLASTTYCAQFSSVVARGNFMGCQFHPERSGEVGSHILKNFLSL